MGTDLIGKDSCFVERLRRVTRLDEPELAILDRTRGPAIKIGPKTDFVREAERLEHLHVLLDGWACRFKLLPGGRRQITDLVLPGDFCDLDRLYASRSDFSVATLSACTVAPIDRAVLRDRAARHPAISEALGFLLVIDNASLAEHNACLGRRSAREHLAHLLCELLIRLTIVGKARDNSFTLLMTQEDIADVLGLSAVHVNRVLQEFRLTKLIEQRGRSIVIHDWNELRRMASFRLTYLHLENVDGTRDIAQAPWALQPHQHPTGAAASG